MSSLTEQAPESGSIYCTILGYPLNTLRSFLYNSPDVPEQQLGVVPLHNPVHE